jgi:GNAT superfamily N-acetyltransferase
MHIRLITADDAQCLVPLWIERYAAPIVAARGCRHDAPALPGFVAEEDGKIIGALTFVRLHKEIEVITLDSFVEDAGVGTALLEGVVALARAEKLRRVCLITTNDNVRAIRFYQKRGWDMVALHRNAVAHARTLKPQIPLTGEHDIPILHEIEFERCV